MGMRRTCAFPRWAVLAALPVAACGAVHRAPAQPGDDPEFPAPEEVELEGLAEDPPQPLRLLPGDRVTLQTVSAETTDFEGLVIDEQGSLHVPLAGDVDVGGLTLTEAEGRVEEALRRYDRVVRVNLFVTALEGHRASVLGAVQDPGIVAVTPGMRLAELLAAAGGPDLTADGGEVAATADVHGARLVRDGSALPVSLPLALQGDPRHNVRVRAGDHLYVPPRHGRLVTVLGDVNGATVVSYYPGLRLTEALAMAGGANFDGDRGDIRVVRGSLRAPRVYRASLSDLVNGRGHNVELVPGDVVFVTQEPIASVGEVLARLSPLLSAGVSAGMTTAVLTIPPAGSSGGGE